MQRGEIQYAKAGEHHIAYREYRGEAGGDHEIVIVSGQNIPMDSLERDPLANRLLEGLAALGRLILFDRRGIALSDPVTDWETPMFEQWAEDLAAVIRATGCDRPAVFSWATPPVARACSLLHPGLIGRLVLFNPTTPPIESDAEWLTEWAVTWARTRAGEFPGEPEPRLAASPGRTADPVFRAWGDDAGRLGASPLQAERLAAKLQTDPPFDGDGQVVTPTLVITRSPPDWLVPHEYFLRAAHLIKGAEHVDLGEGDALVMGLGVDVLLAEISRYVTGEARLPEPERRLTAILFTDIVGSTRLAAASGDAAWRSVLDRHDVVTRTEVGRCGGEVVKLTGDGVLALVPSATAAVDVARRLRDRLAEEGLEVRIGIHIGEVDRRGEDVSGLSVNMASRVMSLAGPGQILATAMVTEIVGSAGFCAIGERTLEGIDGIWQLYSAS